MKISIYIKEPEGSKFKEDSMREYIKRISRFSEVRILPLSKAPDKVSFYVCPGKDSITSVELSERISAKLQSFNDISFILGKPPYGSDSDSFELTSISLSHDTELVLLLEQIYRSFKIMNNETYHK